MEGNEGWEEVSYQIWRPSEGEVLQGVYQGSEPFAGGEYETACLQHFVVTPDGIRRALVGGAALDGIIERGKIGTGEEVRITYLGQGQTTKGRRVNRWKVQVRRPGK